MVAQRVGLGALVFVVGRFALVVCHELAHGLVAESFGRPISRAGIKVALVFPYVFVDTTDAWFESRHRRMMISLAGPASDVVLGGAFALACLVAAPGSVRDILFQVAFGGYVGALFNLNPLMERDGYHVLVDLLREPGLRRRATRHLHEVLAGRGPADSWRLLVYADRLAGVVGADRGLRCRAVAALLPRPGQAGPAGIGVDRPLGLLSRARAPARRPAPATALDAGVSATPGAGRPLVVPRLRAYLREEPLDWVADPESGTRSR